MKVQALIQILSRLNPNAEVLIASQTHYPVENRVCGVSVRGDFEHVESDNRGLAEDCPTDVLLVQGSFKGPGSAQAWWAARVR